MIHASLPGATVMTYSTPADWHDFEGAQALAIKAALDNSAERHPHLRPLRALMPPSLEVTQAFADAYQHSPMLAVRKSVLIRALLADPSAFVPPALAVVGPCVLTRLIAW